MRQFKGEESIVQILTDYHQLEVLAQTPGRRTLRALNASDQKVILKELAVHDLANWKGLELFERELKTLLRLQHPRLPRLLALGLGPAEQAWIQAELQDFLSLDPLPERVTVTAATLPEA